MDESLIFHVAYLGTDQPSLNLNFSKNANMVVAQYYQVCTGMNEPLCEHTSFHYLKVPFTESLGKCLQGRQQIVVLGTAAHPDLSVTLSKDLMTDQRPELRPDQKHIRLPSPVRRAQLLLHAALMLIESYNFDATTAVKEATVTCMP